MTNRPILLTVEGITKAYPGVVANSDVSFTIREGEVHCLLGENGAGKSTMVKMIYGLVKPDTGRMTWKGGPYAPAAPRIARATGVAMVFQHFSLFEALNVAENVALGMENPPPMKELAARIKAVSEAYGLPLDPARMVGDLSAGEMQRAGLILAPRTYSSGEIVYGARSPGRYALVDSYNDALAHVRRLRLQGAHSVKNYNQPRRDQRQQVTAAALAEGMRSVAEGGSLFGLDLTLIADGNTTVEHNLPLGVFYEDVLQFFSQSKTGYTPTLVVTYGGPAGDPYWRAHTEVWKQVKLDA